MVELLGPLDRVAQLAVGLLSPAGREGGCLISSSGAPMPALFKLLGSSLPSEPSPDELGASIAVVAGCLLLLYWNVSFLVSRHDFDIENRRRTWYCSFLLRPGSCGGSHTASGNLPRVW